MKRKLTEEQLIDSYLYAVEKRLPSGQREDILKELRSNILDQLEGAPQGTEAVYQVLGDMGSPDRIAEQYAGRPRYLVGPELLETYWMVVVIVTVVGLAGITFGELLTGDWQITGEFLASAFITRMLSNVFEVLVSSVGTVTLIFIALEQGLYGKLDSAKNAKPWTPDQLELAPNGVNSIKMSDTIWDIVWVLIAFALLNAGLEKISVYFVKGADGVIRSIPFLSTAHVQSYLPWLNCVLAGSLVLGLLQLKTRQWQVWMRLSDIALSLASLVLVVGMLTSPALIIPGAFETIEGVVKETSFAVETGVMMGIRISVAVFVIIEFFNIGTHLVKIFKIRA